MNDRILAINPGATSTKIAYFQNNTLQWKKEFTYSYEELMAYSSVMDQYDFRYKGIADFLRTADFDSDALDAVVGRGGLLPPVEAGAYKVSEEMLFCLKDHPVLEHASNLGAGLAKGIAEEFGTPECEAYIYDPVTVDQMEEVARISGIAQIERKSIGHVLNMRAVCMKVATEELHRSYEACNFVVAHIGGGCSASAHRKGRIIDLISDDESMFSAERSGGLPLKEVLPLCYQYSQKEMNETVRKKGGLFSYFGTNDARKVEALAQEGNEKAKLVLEAMAYQIAKTIGELGTVLYGKVDAIILTGGIAYSERIAGLVKERTSFIGPFHVVPGEEELGALAQGARRVLMGEEAVHVFHDPAVK